MAYRGKPLFPNESTMFIENYFVRKQLSALGYQESFDSLDVIDVECFITIGNMMVQLENDEMNRKSKGGK